MRVRADALGFVYDSERIVLVQHVQCKRRHALQHVAALGTPLQLDIVSGRDQRGWIFYNLAVDKDEPVAAFALRARC